MHPAQERFSLVEFYCKKKAVCATASRRCITAVPWPQTKTERQRTGTYRVGPPAVAQSVTVWLNQRVGVHIYVPVFMCPHAYMSQSLCVPRLCVSLVSMSPSLLALVSICPPVSVYPRLHVSPSLCSAGNHLFWVNLTYKWQTKTNISLHEKDEIQIQKKFQKNAVY